jgi:hypothetical protein
MLTTKEAVMEWEALKCMHRNHFNVCTEQSNVGEEKFEKKQLGKLRVSGVC